MHAEDTGNVPAAVEQFEGTKSFARVLRERTGREVRVDSRDIRRESTDERRREEGLQSVGQEGSLRVAGRVQPRKGTALEILAGGPDTVRPCARVSTTRGSSPSSHSSYYSSRQGSVPHRGS